MRRMIIAVAAAAALVVVGSSSSSSSLMLHVSASITDVISVVMGEQHVCVVEGTTNMAKCFGDNESGALGIGFSGLSRGTTVSGMGINLPFVNLGTNRTIAEIVAGGFFNCAILDNGKIKCWGSNSYGQLGAGLSNTEIGMAPGDMGDNLPYVNLGPNAEILNISCGGFHSCAVLGTHEAKCWGNNVCGQLGLGNLIIILGLDPTQMGDALPAISLGTSVSVLAIAAGGYHTCVLLAPAQMLKCFGQNTYGQLGIGLTETVVGTLHADMGDNLPYVDLGTNVGVLDFVLGLVHSCAIVTGSLLKCWGSNLYGQLGRADSTGAFGTLPIQMGDNLPFVDLGTGVTALKIALGGYHTCTLTNTFQIKCWGDNAQGQLGIGSTIGRVPDGIAANMGSGLHAVAVGTGLTVRAISAGMRDSCALLSTQKVKCWGQNLQGQLGICSTVNIGLSAVQMGNNLAYADDCGPNSLSPTKHPTKPTRSPTKLTKTPTRHPTDKVTKLPTKNPTLKPGNAPTRKPTKLPTTHLPTKLPTTHKPVAHTPTKKPVKTS